jgi:hypothetical protein
LVTLNGRIVKVVLLAAGTIGLVVGLFMAYGRFRRHAAFVTASLERVPSIAEALKAGAEPDAGELLRFAAASETRRPLYHALAYFDRLDLFPRQYFTFEALAESDLVHWLQFPTELDGVPDEIQLGATVKAPSPPDGNSVYFVFRFRVHAPHWAAKDGWMAGVAGPYDLGATPAPYARGTFSRFDAYDSRTPEEHVRVTQELLARVPR